MFALEVEERERLSLAALPVDKLHWTYVNAQRDPGEVDEKGNVKRKPAPIVPFDSVRTFGPRKPNLDAKSKPEDWDYSVQGAKADRGQFESWAGARSHTTFVPTKED